LLFQGIAFQMTVPPTFIIVITLTKYCSLVNKGYGIFTIFSGKLFPYFL